MDLIVSYYIYISTAGRVLSTLAVGHSISTAWLQAANLIAFRMWVKKEWVHFWDSRIQRFRKIVYLGNPKSFSLSGYLT
jgi:hypothetical protein